jgi:hypothetical protein
MLVKAVASTTEKQPAYGHVTLGLIFMGELGPMTEGCKGPERLESRPGPLEELIAQHDLP